MLVAAGAAEESVGRTEVDLFFADGAAKIDIDNDGVPDSVVT